jgi:AAR2 protein
VRDPISGDELDRLRANLKNLDRNLGSYPYGDWKKWVSLTNKISVQTISRYKKDGSLHLVWALKVSIHKRFGSGVFAVRCDFKRKSPSPAAATSHSCFLAFVNNHFRLFCTRGQTAWHWQFNFTLCECK